MQTLAGGSLQIVGCPYVGDSGDFQTPGQGDVEANHQAESWYEVFNRKRVEDCTGMVVRSLEDGDKVSVLVWNDSATRLLNIVAFGREERPWHQVPQRTIHMYTDARSTPPRVAAVLFR